MEQVPSIGRIVHYVSYGTPGGEYPRACRAAIITELNERYTDFAVGLAVLNPTGMFFHRELRHHNVEGDVQSDEDSGGTWHWPERV